MKTLRHKAIGSVGEKRHAATLSTRAWNCMRTLTGKDDPTIGDFRAVVTSLPESVSLHGYIKEHSYVGVKVADELTAFAVRNGMREYAERPEGYGLSIRTYNVLRSLTEKDHPTREDFRELLNGIPDWKDLRNEFLHFRNAGREVVDELVAFAKVSGLGEYFERPRFWGLTRAAFLAIIRLTEKRDDLTVNDFCSWIGGLPRDVNLMHKLKKTRNVSLKAARELVAFAVSKGFIKGTPSEPDYSI